MYKIINNNYISETESVFLCQENGIKCTYMCVSVARSLVGQHHNTASLSWIPRNYNTAAVDWIGSNCTVYEKILLKTKKIVLIYYIGNINIDNNMW